SVLFFWIFRRRKTDLIFAHAIVFPTFVSILIRYVTGIKVVCYVHGGDLNSYYNQDGILNKVLKFSLNNADHVVANSRDIYDKIVGVSSNPNISIITPGVDLKVMMPLENLP